MGVGINLVGNYPSARLSAEQWLQRVGDWIDEVLPGHPTWGNLHISGQQGQRGDGKLTLFVHFYPQNEPVEFFVPRPGQMIVSAKTSILGPGYHIALCQILHYLGEQLGITWEGQDRQEGIGDPTGYFHTADRTALEAEMLQHLRTLTSILADNLHRNAHFHISLSMPIMHRFEGGPIRTIVGVRDLEWLTLVQSDPGNGIDLFPWWEEGLTPRFYLGRALVEICMNVRWRRHKRDDDEWDRLDGIHRDLSRAHAADPTLPFPWREWAEILDYLDYHEPPAEQVRQRAEQEPEGPRLGYRRHPVHVLLTDGWSITINGNMTEQWQDGTWSASDGERTIWFSCWNAEVDDRPLPAGELMGRCLEQMDLTGDQVPLRNPGMIGQGVIVPYDEDDEANWNLKAVSAVDGRLALCNLFYQDEADREWAIRQWHALKCAAPRKDG